MSTMTRHGSATVTTPSDREILITRTFDRWPRVRKVRIRVALSRIIRLRATLIRC